MNCIVLHFFWLNAKGLCIAFWRKLQIDTVFFQSWIFSKSPPQSQLRTRLPHFAFNSLWATYPMILLCFFTSVTFSNDHIVPNLILLYCLPLITTFFKWYAVRYFFPQPSILIVTTAWSYSFVFFLTFLTHFFFVLGFQGGQFIVYVCNRRQPDVRVIFSSIVLSANLVETLLFFHYCISIFFFLGASEWLFIISQVLV